MQKITVKEVKGPLGRGDKKFFAVVDEKGAEFTTFDTKIKDVSIGSILEIELKVEGKYVNIVEWKVVEEGQPAQIQSQPKVDRIRIYADFKIAAIQVAGRLAASGKIEQKDIPSCAGDIYQWLTSRDKAQAQPAPDQTIDEAWEGMEQEKRDPDTIKNLGNLFTACSQDFNMTANEVVKELGHSNKEEITEPAAECYRIISATKGKSPLNNPRE